MVKIPVAQQRLYKNIFVCKRCSLKRRATPKHIIEKRVKCRRCGRNEFRPIRKKT
ncbi:MAG TPA: hypothetical protein HA282_05725 [Nanoarchaeota archaeon]|nr:MAG: hypothetical protein QT01_C0001G0085 [archaeon GW2011_AR6]MBS3082583.1 hypothetical protein [Candidatus Pacearchaeota archaeon]HIH17456.1 hypothetical protein [Nanoarchaeota archaeon]HIH33961.1 hypothetical protein [Nanoarchaeota archaeon]HIH51748.1 hypothetical protein [Nanoarchaeota archaeon]